MSDLKKVKKEIADSWNLEVETEALQKKLFNINTGKATSDDIHESLLSIPKDDKPDIKISRILALKIPTGLKRR